MIGLWGPEKMSNLKKMQPDGGDYETGGKLAVDNNALISFIFGLLLQRGRWW